MQHEGFDLVPKLIGREGCRMRRIHEETGAKIRIRGRGSGHREGPMWVEAATPLMVSVTAHPGADEASQFERAVGLVLGELRSVAGEYKAFCRRLRSPSSERAPFSLGDFSDISRESLDRVMSGAGLPGLGAPAQ